MAAVAVQASPCVDVRRLAVTVDPFRAAGAGTPRLAGCCRIGR